MSSKNSGSSLMLPFGKATRSRANAEGQYSVDMSVLRPSINVPVTGMTQAVKALENGSAEMRQFLLHECNVIYECKVCFNMFRSLANFTAHKRAFCVQRFQNVKHVHHREPDQYPDEGVKSMATAFVVPEAVDTVIPEPNFNLDDYSPSLELLKDAGLIQEIESKILCPNLKPQKPSLDLIVQNLRQRAVQDRYPITPEESSIHSVRLEKLTQTSQAVFQTVGSLDEVTTGQKYIELEQLKQKPAVFIGPKGNIVEPGVAPEIANPLGSVQNKSSDKVFPCPLCSKMFSRTRNVQRHAINLHKKSLDAAIKLKNQSKKMAMRKDQKDILGDIRIGRASCDDKKFPCKKCIHVSRTWDENLLHDICHNNSQKLPIVKMDFVKVPIRSSTPVLDTTSESPEPLVKLSDDKDTEGIEVVDMENFKTQMPLTRQLKQKSLNQVTLQDFMEKNKNCTAGSDDEDVEEEISFKINADQDKDSGISGNFDESLEDDLSVENHPKAKIKPRLQKRSKNNNNEDKDSNLIIKRSNACTENSSPSLPIKQKLRKISDIEDGEDLNFRSNSRSSKRFKKETENANKILKSHNVCIPPTDKGNRSRQKKKY